MNHNLVKDILIQIGEAVCRKVNQSLKEQTVEQRSAVFKEGEDDTIYQIDRDVEEVLVPILEKNAKELNGIVLVAEGIGENTNGVVLPKGKRPESASLRIIVDPIDGTRGIMYDKRSAFFLAAAAPNRGASTTLQDVEVAVMAELPTSRSFLSDTLWAIKGKGAHAYTRNLLSGDIMRKDIHPSRSKSLIGGFGQIARFFPPGRDILAKIEDELIETIAPDVAAGKAVVFEDQYISSGGQLYEMLMGHDRFIADIRTLLYRKLAKEGKRAGHVCHPYDLCATLIGKEAGLIITDAFGNPLDTPLDLLASVDWIGYANEHIRNEIEPVLQKLMQKYGLWED
jgi:fructose-1,6-bisphosphatase/inositol monophosphatase family enzyme